MLRIREVLVVALLLTVAAGASAQRVRLSVPMDELVRRAAQDSNDAPTQYDVALGYWLDRKFDLAEQHLRQAIAIEPKTAAAYLALSYLPYARRTKLWDEEDDGKVPAEWVAPLEEAWAFRRRAFLIDPMVDLKPVALMIPPASTLGLTKRQQGFYTYLMNGYGSFWVGDYVKAYGFFQEIMKGVPDADRKEYASWFLWYEALAAAHANDHPRAVSNLRLLLERATAAEQRSGGATLVFSQANHYRYTLACVLDMGGQTKEAVDLLQEVLTNDLGLYAAHVRLAEIYERQHRTNASLAERRRAVATNPEDPSLVADLGEALARAGEVDDALATLRRAVAANPRSHRAWYLLGALAEQRGAREEARTAYARFLELAPSRWDSQRTEVQQKLTQLN